MERIYQEQPWLVHIIPGEVSMFHIPKMPKRSMSFCAVCRYGREIRYHAKERWLRVGSRMCREYSFLWPAKDGRKKIVTMRATFSIARNFTRFRGWRERFKKRRAQFLWTTKRAMILSQVAPFEIDGRLVTCYDILACKTCHHQIMITRLAEDGRLAEYIWVRPLHAFAAVRFAIRQAIKTARLERLEQALRAADGTSLHVETPRWVKELTPQRFLLT
jgi:hypothetical protein